MKKAIILVLLAILAFMLGQLSYQDAKSSLADTGAAILKADLTPAPTQDVFVITMEETPKPTNELTPPPDFDEIIASQNIKQEGGFSFKEYEMPRDLEVLWNKILWYSPLKSEKGKNPNKEKIAILWVIINEYESGKVIDSNGGIREYSTLSAEDQTSFNFTWLFPKDFEKLMMRPGDHDWFINSVKTNQPWHESEVNNNIVHIVYNVWMSEKAGLDSGRFVPREYIYYTFTKDASGSNRKLVLFKEKSDLVNFENPYDWSLQGVTD